MWVLEVKPGSSVTPEPSLHLESHENYALVPSRHQCKPSAQQPRLFCVLDELTRPLKVRPETGPDSYPNPHHQ